MRITPLRWVITLGSAIGLATIYGCAGDSSSAYIPAVIRDSASITIVENSAPLWSEGEGWRLSDQPVTAIGIVEGPQEYQFHDVMGVIVQSDGTIVVGDMGSSQLRFFDAGGRHLRTTSGQGNGPGEIGQLIRLSAFRGDSLLVTDGRAMLHLFDSSGAYVTSFNPTPGRLFPATPAGYTRDGGIFFFLSGDSPQQISEPIRFEYAPALMRRPEGTMDTITTVLSATFYPGWRGTPTLPLFEGGSVQVVALSDGIVAGTSNGFELQRFDLEGRVARIIRRAWDPQPVPGGLRERYAEMYVSGAGENGNPVPEQLRQQRREIQEATPVASFLPAFTRLRSDPDDNLWVRETDAEHLAYPSQGWNTFDTVASTWNIFDPEGIWLGTVETPENFVIMEIGRDYIAGLTRDDLGVEMVQVYALNK